MVVNRKVTGKAMSMPAGLVIGWIVSMVLTILGALAIALLILSEKLGVEAIGYGAIVTLILAAATGAWLAAMLIKRRWMIVCLGTGGIYYLTLLAITALFFGGQYQGIGVTALAILSGSGAVGFLGLKGENTGRKKSKKYHFR
ncbi:MAG: hypothetical protein IJW14_01195 [Oscillospiraceae bacterium]|nr:hypothetical protein [Oscillospiraceae bacterium]